MTRYQERIQPEIDFYLAYLLTQSPWRLCVIVDTSRIAIEDILVPTLKWH